MKSINVHPSVHKDITERLCKINAQLSDRIHEILMENKQERHIRGGLATREKYLKVHRSKVSER